MKNQNRNLQGKNRDWVQYCSLKEKDIFIWECDNLLPLSSPGINSRRVEGKAAMNRRTPKFFATLSERYWDWLFSKKKVACICFFRLGEFWTSDSGQSEVEYAFILAFVTMTLKTSLILLGQTINQSILPLARDIH